MLILLPPSEGKTAGGTGAPVDLDSLSWPQLTNSRQRLATTLVKVCQGNPVRARERLGLSAALDGDRAANAELWVSATMPAGERYCGVLHDAAGYPTLPAKARARGDATIIVFSGLWGATRPTDQVPSYRVGIATDLPRIGPLSTYWRAPLHAALDAEVASHGAIDLRSSGYSQMYRPSETAAKGMLTVRVTGPDGKRAAASYPSKVAKGRLVRAMLLDAEPNRQTLLSAVERLGLTASIDGGVAVVRVPEGWGLVGTPNPLDCPPATPARLSGERGH